MDELVKILANKKHDIVFESRTKEFSEVKKRIEQGFVFIKFLETKGETELGINVDHDLTNFNKAESGLDEDIVNLVGTCELNFTKVRFKGEIDLKTRSGKGSLEILR